MLASRARCLWFLSSPSPSPAVPAAVPRNDATRAIRVILISIDGFRADYLDRGLTPTLASLAADGVRADAMKPSFPDADVSESLHARDRALSRSPRHRQQPHDRSEIAASSSSTRMPRRDRRSRVVGRRAALGQRREAGPPCGDDVLARLRRRDRGRAAEPGMHFDGNADARSARRPVAALDGPSRRGATVVLHACISSRSITRAMTTGPIRPK